MKTFIHHDYQNLKQINESGVRFYSTESGEKYPSVTSVVGVLNKEAILEWRKRVGEQEANRISARAANRGTRIHSLCELYLKGEQFSLGITEQEMFSSLIPELDRINNIHALEQRLISHRLKIAGTVDAIAEYDGQLSVIDFKTSRRIKTYDEITSYFLQVSAYAFMFYEATGLVVDQSVILIGVDGEKTPLVFIEPIKPWLQAFMKVRSKFRETYGY